MYFHPKRPSICIRIGRPVSAFLGQKLWFIFSRPVHFGRHLFSGRWKPSLILIFLHNFNFFSVHFSISCANDNLSRLTKIKMPSRDLDWHGTPLASLSDSRSQQPISFIIKHFRSSWGFCLAARMITCSRGKSRATTHACDSRLWQFLVTAISNIKNNLIRAVRPVRTVWSVRCSSCSDSTNCSVCSDCSGNVDCSDCLTCSGCSTFFDNFRACYSLRIPRTLVIESRASIWLRSNEM